MIAHKTNDTRIDLYSEISYLKHARKRKVLEIVEVSQRNWLADL